MSSASQDCNSLKEGLVLRLHDIMDRQGDLGIESDSDETRKEKASYNVDTNSISTVLNRRESANLSDSAVSSNPASIASSVMTDKPQFVWMVTNDDDEKDPACTKSPDEQRQSYRRASSLKTSRALDEGQSSSQKKAVRFADALGLDLTAVKQLMDADYFANPPSWCQQKPDVVTRKILRPVFEQPSAKLSSSFRRHVLEKNVCLENLLTNELTMIGSVRVANIAFTKRVFIRYTTDCWRHVADKEATYVSLSCDGETDRFSFTITAPADINQYGLAEFCVCFVANGTEYWDSNDGRNYVCEVVMEEVGAPYGSDLSD